MALTHCPDCGAQVSESAVVCPHCGFPLRRDALAAATAGRGGGGGFNTAGLVIGIVVAGVIGIVIIGILAALAIPRFSQASTRAKEKEGEAVLKQVYTLENAYYANNGVYAPTLEELRVVGWDPANGTMLNFSSVEVVQADSSVLCAQVLPREGGGVQPIRIITSGEIQHGMRCSDGETRYDADMDDTTNALGVLGDVTIVVAAWRRDHDGRFPATEAELVEAYPRAADDLDFAMHLVPGAPGGFCMRIARRTNPPSPTLFTLDGGGNAYRSESCLGKPVEHFDATSALGVLSDMTSGVAAWRRDHDGRFPATDAELVEAYPTAADNPDFAIYLVPGTPGTFCVRIARRTNPPSPPLFTLDGSGNVYQSESCQGEPIEHFIAR